MKKMLSITLAILMVISLSVNVFADMAFTDVTTDDWFYDDVKTAYEMGLINGKTSTTYAPYDNVTYAEVIKLAACMNQLYVDGAVTLTGGDPWYMPYVEYCKKNGIITKEYSFDEYATRAGYMEIFANALPDSAFEPINDIPDGSIADVKNDAAYADSVYKLYRAGIVTGVDEKHNCNPTANIIRAEVATIISRMMNEEKRVSFDMPEFNEVVVNIGTVDDTDISNKTPTIEINTKPDDDPVIVVPPTS